MNLFEIETTPKWTERNLGWTKDLQFFLKIEEFEIESVRDKNSSLYKGLQCLGGRHH